MICFTVNPATFPVVSAHRESMTHRSHGGDSIRLEELSRFVQHLSVCAAYGAHLLRSLDWGFASPAVVDREVCDTKIGGRHPAPACVPRLLWYGAECASKWFPCDSSQRYRVALISIVTVFIPHDGYIPPLCNRLASTSQIQRTFPKL